MLRSLISRADRQLFSKLNTNARHCLVRILPPERNLETRSTLRARVIVSVCHSAKVNFLKICILILYYSCIFNFNLFHFMFLLFRRVLYKVVTGCQLLC